MNIKVIGVILVSFLMSCNESKDAAVKQTTNPHEHQHDQGLPKVSFTFDDGITHDIANYAFEDWNQMILSSMEKEEIKAVFFVTGSNKLDDKGKFLLQSWTEKGHKIANHTYSHPNFNNEKITIPDFEDELLRTDKIISAYPNYLKLFRFPYLKEGNTEDKVNGFRNILTKHGYRNGYVSIDASDWYINSELIKSIKAAGPNNPKIELYRSFYLQHIMERANYYESLSYELTNRHIHHTLLLHHNLSSALFLDELIQTFKESGWEIVDADHAFKDTIYHSLPNTIPAGESIIWSLAKASGEYEDQLRYPAEDSRYEIPKMKKLGI